MCGGVGVWVVFLLIQLSGLFELRQLAVQHVGGGGHGRLGGQQGGDGGALLGLVLASPHTLLQAHRDRGVSWNMFVQQHSRDVDKLHSASWSS